ncbi:MAG: hypothetical protein K0B14_17890, partial [Anaerolineaceae bacterium]|nr:hypothetical protein [Anaerolineaceae bacterium]
MGQIKFFLRASLDVFQELTRLVTDWQLSCRSCPSFEIPSDFFGVNVAAAENPQSDGYILERLKALDIKQVRMAFTYDSFDSPSQRLLDQLLAKGFDVMLVVVPPREKARAILFDTTAQNEWIAFVRKVLSRYAGSVSILEVGSTPNRKKWSGYRLRSYIKAWQLATKQVEHTAICLAGPNVQDFEPHANRLLLKAMQRISVAPNVHTNNLFVERVIEPEAYDHRALGALATKVVKLNLIKKARILKSIGSRVGCQRFFSTCFFWSTKRLRRTSLWPQQKKVDYKARYLILAASSGALDRIYWGPLICSRDGLICDGNTDYPEIDHSTFYGKIRGEYADFSITPAFKSLAYVSKRLQGSFCEAAVNTVEGLHHFSFKGADGRYFHACWCRDGQAIRLTDLYSPEQLAMAEFTDACGFSVTDPMSISEQVFFVDFPSATSQVLAAVSSPASYHYPDADVFYPSSPVVDSYFTLDFATGET